MGMFQRKIMLVAVLILSGLPCAYAADITGKWTAEFDTQIGQQKYLQSTRSNQFESRTICP